MNSHKIRVALLTFIFALATCGAATYPDWMGQNRDKLKNLPLNQVVLLGSHDAASCDIHEYSLPVTGYLTHHHKHIHRLAKARDVGSARCQSATITEQLMYGVRYLDMRIAHQDGEYWGTHMWLSTPVFGDGGIFTQIKSFLAAHPGEIILLNFNELYSEKKPMNKKQKDAFYKKVEQEFGSLLARKGEFASTTLDAIWNSSGRIVAIGDEAADEGREFIWDRRKVDSPWMNEQDPAICCSKLTAVLAAWKTVFPGDNLRVLQGMTTTENKIDDAAQTNALLRQLFRSEWKDYPVNIIQVDDSVNSGLMPIIFERNKLSQPK